VHTADIVNWGDLRTTVIASVLAAVGLTGTFGLVLLGSIHANDAYRAGRLARAAGFWALAAAALAVCLGGVALGLIAMTDK